MPWKHGVDQLPSIHTNIDTSNFGGHEVLDLVPRLSNSSESGRSTYPRSRSAAVQSSRVVVVLVCSPNALHQESNNKAKSAERVRTGETCVGARRRHALVSSPRFDSPHLWLGRGKGGISDVIRLICPQSAVAICFVSSSHEAMRLSQRDKRPSRWEYNTLLPSTKEMELFQTTRKYC